MNNKIIKLKLTVAHAKCEKCGLERILHFTSSYTYGERVVSTVSGKKCAYVNLLDENVMQELEEQCMNVFQERGVEISQNKLARIVPYLYGVTCDDINGEKVDTISALKCPCCLGKMVEDDKYGEKVEEIDAFMVTHSMWARLSREEKRKEVVGELIRQGYLS